MYHRFGEAQYPSTNIKLEQFESQLNYLANNDYTVWPLNKIIQRLHSGMDIPDKTIAITVDDAYLSVYEQAYPLLLKRNWPFTVFVSTDAIDQKLPNFMTWKQMRKMKTNGVHFANHSSSHDYLIHHQPDESPASWEARIKADIEKSQHRLQQELGDDTNTSPRLFAFPYGEYNIQLTQLLEEMNYIAFGQQSGAMGEHSHWQYLPRFPIAENFSDLKTFSVKANSRNLPVQVASPEEPNIIDNNPPVLTIRLDKSNAQLSQLACYASEQGALKVEWLNKDLTEFRIVAKKPLPKGRSRYNCTAPDASGKRYYWYSHLWINSPTVSQPVVATD
ncbi:MAG: polysaccharide deacetylase family protein [Gammaproteobacteria bacterium]|nr:polysaccharide deacetylase family protein [Gammaproteobacteria bacterium]